MKILATCVVGLSIFILGATSAHAGNYAWSSTASACTPEPSSVSLASFDSVSGTVQFAAGQTGTIKLTCAVSGFDKNFLTTTVDRLQISHVDYQGGTACRVRAHLLRLAHKPPLSGATIASVSSTDTGSNTYASAVQAFTHSFNFDANYYWVQLVVERNSTACSPIAYGVSLYLNP